MIAWPVLFGVFAAASGVLGVRTHVDHVVHIDTVVAAWGSMLAGYPDSKIHRYGVLTH